MRQFCCFKSFYLTLYDFRCLSMLQTATIPLFESNSPCNISLDTIMAINRLLFTSFRMDGDWIVLVYQGRNEADFLSNIMNGRPHSSLNLFLILSSFPMHNSDKRKTYRLLILLMIIYIALENASKDNNHWAEKDRIEQKDCNWLQVEVIKHSLGLTYAIRQSQYRSGMA